MKKLTGTPKSRIFRVLLILLIVAMTVSGCAFSEQTPEPTEEPTKPTSKYNNPMDLPEDMLDAINDYLKSRNEDRMVVKIPNAERKIDDIKNGTQALHVAFDSSCFYYVCGYYNITEQHTEFPTYCCAKDYVWVKFESVNDIQEYYNDTQFAVAFQINKALFVRDISQRSNSVPNVEHFQLYTPEFKEGFNINVSLDFAETFIYLNRLDCNVLYLSMTKYNHSWTTFPCIYLENQYHIPIQLYIVYLSGNRYESDLNREFGAYYDAVVNIMEVGKYSIVFENGKEAFYGLISVDDFVNKIIQ